jgi:ribosomal protein S18 acetylase RimI-like enzyme
VDEETMPEKLYIMTLVTLASYRRRGVGRALLESVLKYAKEELEVVKSVYLHVQTSNDAAIKFYESFGFKVQETIKGYYKRIDPPDCYVLVKTL